MEKKTDDHVKEIDKRDEVVHPHNSFTQRVDDKEVTRIQKLIKESFKRTPPKLNFEANEYDFFNKILSETNYDNCFDGVDIARTTYEAMFPIFQQLYADKAKAEKETEYFKRPMFELYMELKEREFPMMRESIPDTLNRFTLMVKGGSVNVPK